MKKFLFLLILLATSSQLYSQEVRYIRDELHVPLRSGQSSQHRIVHKGLISGTRVTVLETNESGTYSKVKTKNGTEGWIQTQYLNPQPAARDLLNAARTNISRLEEKNSELSQQLKAITSKASTAAQQLSQLSADNSEKLEELERIKTISANAIQLNEDNRRLLEENQKLKNEVEILSTDNRRLEDNHENEAFLNGGLLVLIGVMITLIVPRLWPSKRTDWA